MEYSFGRFQNTPMGGYSGTHPDQGSFLYLQNSTTSEESAKCGYRTSNDSKSIIRFQLLILPSHTDWLQKTGKSHPNEPVSTSTRPFACQWFHVSTALGTSKVSQSLGTSASTEDWPPSLRRTESGGITFQRINQTTKPGGKRETVDEAVEKSTSQGSLEANATSERNGGLMRAKK